LRFSIDPELEAKVVDVVGVYLDPPEGPVVLCCDEKSQIQALERTAPILPIAPHLIERRWHDYRRHGTTTLFAAWRSRPGDHHSLSGPAPPPGVPCGRSLPPTPMSSCTWCWTTTARTASGREGLARGEPEVHVHFTPTHASWMNMVEIWFSMAERQGICQA
jgi:hypothetical protein